MSKLLLKTAKPYKIFNLMKTNFKIVLNTFLIAFMLSACKKELPNPTKEEVAPSAITTSGNAVYKSPKPVVIKQNPLPPGAKNKPQNDVLKGRFYTQYGAVHGVKFSSRDGNEVVLEQSRVKSPQKTYNAVTKKGNYFKREELSEGMTKSQILRLADKDKWPDHIVHGIKSDDNFQD